MNQAGKGDRYRGDAKVYAERWSEVFKDKEARKERKPKLKKQKKRERDYDDR